MTKNEKQHQIAKQTAVLLIALLLSLFVFIAFAPNVAGAAAPPPAPSGGLPIINSIVGPWVAFAYIVILILILAGASAYLLAGTIDSPTAKAWGKGQIYEGLLAALILSAFLGFTALLSLNPLSLYQSANLVGTNNNGSNFACSSVSDLFTLASCDFSKFDQYSYGIFNILFYATVYAGYTPGFGVEVNLFQGEPQTNINFGGGFELSSFFPVGADDAFGILYSLLLTLFVVNQIQMILISGSLLWLGLFVSLGVLARAFGVTRSFGGAMIALGLGLGFVYPLMVSITYGYLNYSISNNAAVAQPATLGGYMFAYVLQIGCDVITGNDACIPLAGGATWLPATGSTWIYGLGAAVAGMTFIPFLNFTIVDAFIIDFSKAIGEKLDFMSLMGGII